MAAGVDVRERLLAFHAAHYSAGTMRLVVLGKESLDALERLVVGLFAAIPNKATPTHAHAQSSPSNGSSACATFFYKFSRRSVLS